MKTWQIILSGVGGQGLVFCGNLLGEAACVEDGKNAVMTTSYGVETRGTFTKSDLIISTEEIDFPEVQTPDAVVALAGVAYERYVGNLTDDALLIYDCAGITPKESNARQYAFNMQEIAERLGSRTSANVLALGILIGLTGAVDPESVARILDKRFAANPAKLNINQSIYRAGLRMAAEAAAEQSEAANKKSL